MYQNIKRTISLILVSLMILCLIPQNTAYGAEKFTWALNTRKVSLTSFTDNNNRKYFSADFVGAGLQAENSSALTRLYDFDPSGIYNEGNWTNHTVDEISVIRPGERYSAAVGFVVDLDAHNMLGSAMKGQLTAKSGITYKNYSGDNDWGAPTITTFDSGGNTKDNHVGNYVRATDWTYNETSLNLSKVSRYVMFGGTGYRRDGVLNKNLDLNLNYMMGSLHDSTSPYVVSISSQNEYIKQINPDPLLSIKMSEDISGFSNMKALLTASDGSTYTAGLELIGEESFDYSNGDVTYKFRIKLEDLKDVKKNFTKIGLESIRAVDTFGNVTTDTKSLSIDKRIDTMPPDISFTAPNSFKVSDYFGLSKVTASLKYGIITNTNNILNPGTQVKIDSAQKETNIAITNTTTYTGEFKATVEAWDLANNYKILDKNLFMISDSHPVLFNLMNSDSPMFAYSPDAISEGASNALTNMYLKTSIDAKYLSGAKIYYKWHNSYDESILTQDPTVTTNNWNNVSFKANLNETNPITIPVQKVSDGFVSYLEPKYEKGYLYIIPYMKDDTAGAAKLRTGSVALSQRGVDTGGKFSLVDSKPVEGTFVNRGCDCTGQGEGTYDHTHYNLTGNHKKDIGFKVTKNHEYLSSIRYFISNENNSSSYITQGSLLINDTKEYDIPISSISNKTGKYNVQLVLYSDKGDVTVHNIPVSIESPVIGVSNILYNQVTQNLDFTITYSKNSLVDGELNDIQIEFGNDSITEFQDFDEDIPMSLYAISEDGIIPKENWSTDIENKAFIRTEFHEFEKDSNLMTADFRASLLNMETSGDNFIKTSGEKRVHLKYTSSNKVEVFNNNVTLIKKSNLPPSISKVEGVEGTYMTASQYNSADSINVKIEEVIVDLKHVYYAWVDTADTSLINADKTISGLLLMDDDKDNVIELKPKFNNDHIITGDELYKPYYLVVYAENTAGKYIERSFGPFYVLNEDIINKRFEITVTGNAMAENQIFIAVDDKLHMIDELPKPNEIKVTWQQGNYNCFKDYDISFDTEDGTTNVALVNIPYVSLSDTDGLGGEFKLVNIELCTLDESTRFKSIATDITKILPQHFVTINGLNVVSDSDEIKYQWSKSPYDMPTSWITTSGAITGIDFIAREKESYILSKIYLFLYIWDNIYRTDKVYLDMPDSIKEIKPAFVKIGEADGSYYGTENGVKESLLIRISVNEPDDLNHIQLVECYDKLSVTSATAIKVNKMYKISDTEIAGLIHESIVTSGGAIKCNIRVNGFDIGEITSNNAEKTGDFNLSYEITNRIITLKDVTNITEYEKYSLYQNDDREYKFDNEGKTEIYEDGDYLLIYRDDSNTIAKEIIVSGIKYSVEDIEVELNPEKPAESSEPAEEKISQVTATITMPLGSVITDKYDVISSIEVIDSHVVATAVITRSAIYSFNVKFANDQVIEYKIYADYLDEDYTPVLSLVTSSSAISYTPNGPILTIYDVTASVGDGYTVLNNNRTPSYKFSKNGTYSFVLKDAEGNIQVHEALVDWIDKDCPKPLTKKYVWYDFNDDGKIDAGEKGAEIPKGYKTKNNLIVEITFPHENEEDRPVKLNSLDGFIIDDMSTAEGYAYKYILPYKPSTSEDKTPEQRQTLTFIDTLGNELKYNLVIDEIDRTDLLTQLNYSTTNYTNRDVVVSMSANRPVKRFDIVKDDDGKEIKKDASPTYVFKENGTKDFNYEQIEVVDDPLKGKLTANVTWIDKSVPTVNVEFNNTITNKDVVIKFTVIDGVAENAKLKYGTKTIELSDKGIGTFNVYENGTYMFEISNKYGSTGSVFVPVNNIDKEAPEISIAGRTITYIKANSKYFDKGATAFDNRDKDVTKGISVVSNVNTSIATKGNPYTVTYSVTDEAGNISEATRYVHVLDINSAVVVINDKVIDLKEQGPHDVSLTEGGIVITEFVGIEGTYTVKYAKGTGYDNAYFKTKGSHMSKQGTFVAEEGKYTLYMQDQERNTRIITLNFVK